MINGIIFISTPSCCIESTINNLAIVKNKNIPSLNIKVDENNNDIDVEIKLENFINIIKTSDIDE